MTNGQEVKVPGVSLETQPIFERTPKGQFNGIVRFGLVTSHIYNDDFGGFNKLGGTVGVGTFTQIARNWKAQFEIDYAMRGSRKRPTKKDPSTYRIEPHYIDIPILFKTNFWILEAELGVNNGIYLFHIEADEFGRILPGGYGWRFNRYELAGLLGVSAPLGEKWVTNARFHYSILPAAGRSFAVVGGRFITGGAYNNAVTFSLHRLLIPKS